MSIKFIAPAAIGAGAFVLLAGAAAGGYVLHQPGPPVTRTVTVTRTVPGPVRTVTVTRTRTVTGPASPPSVPCTENSGIVDPGVVVPGVTQGETTCTVTVVSPAGASHLGEASLQAPDGTSSTFTLTRVP